MGKSKGGGSATNAGGGKGGRQAAGGGGQAAGGGDAAAGPIGSGGGYTLEIREGCVALMRFRTRDGMNTLLDPISNAVEGTIANRLGHNFVLSDTDRLHHGLRKACGLPKQVRYVIATLEGDAHSIRHEMCHARYYLEPPYKDLVQRVWEGGLTAPQRHAITAFLSRLKYDEVSHVDEFQAYLVTEKHNFFGMDLAGPQADLQAAFGPLLRKALAAPSNLQECSPRVRAVGAWPWAAGALCLRLWLLQGREREQQLEMRRPPPAAACGAGRQGCALALHAAAGGICYPRARRRGSRGQRAAFHGSAR